MKTSPLVPFRLRNQVIKPLLASIAISASFVFCGGLLNLALSSHDTSLDQALTRLGKVGVTLIEIVRQRVY